MAERSYIAQESKKDNLACKSSGISCWWAMFQHLCWSLLGIAELDPLDSVDNPSVTLARFLFGAFLIMGVILLVNMMIALLSNTYQRVEDNACMEWSFKKAITIQTYSTYHPIPVPLNLISNVCIGLYRLCKKWLSGCRRKDENDCEEDRIKSLDAVVKNLQLAYYAIYGYCFPLTDDRKMDQVVYETERNRQMANQFAQRTFTAQASEQVMLPTGPEAWQSQGIRIEGCLLACEGGNFCNACKGESDECHGARYLVPFSRKFPYFEVLIQETEEQRFLGVGVVRYDYRNHAMPGHFKRTVGYLVDEGKIFGPFEPVNLAEGKEYEGSMAYRGDLIGCTVKFEEEKDDQVPIVFTLNGKQITKDKILIEYKPSQPRQSLYPFISMGHTGIRVLAKMCPSPNDDLQLIGKIEAKTGVITDKMNSRLDQVDTVAKQMHGELKNAKKEFKKLISLVLEELQHFNELILDPDEVEWVESAPPEPFYLSEEEYKGPVHEKIRETEIEYLNQQSGPDLADLQPQNSLLNSAQENLVKLAQTEGRFSSVLESLKAVETKAKSHRQCQKKNEERVEKELCRFKQLLKFQLRYQRKQLEQSGPEVFEEKITKSVHE